MINESILKVKENIKKVIVGKDGAIDLLLTALLAGGHVLLDDVPGVGKTKLANALARSVGLVFRRIQFTPDLQPADITGLFYFDQQQGKFLFRPGPLHTQILLADEINRAVPRTQSSLLEAMEERQVTVEGQCFPLEPPFMVLATENPVEMEGTFPLPEAQLDRFLLRLSLGYPNEAEEVQILLRFQQQDPLETLAAVISKEQLVSYQKAVTQVRTAPALLAYIARLSAASRRHPDVALGLSPRASLAVLRASMAYAFLQGRSFVLPDDVKYVFPAAAGHRILLRDSALWGEQAVDEVIEQVAASVEVPVEGDSYESWS